MKKTVINKLAIIILIIMSLFTILSTYTYASSSIIAGGKKFEEAQNRYRESENLTDDEKTTIDSEKLKEASNTVYNILLLLGIVIAVIIGIVLGIKFITGSVEEQAKVKESLIPYVVGCVVIFGAFTIWKIVLQILQKT